MMNLGIEFNEELLLEVAVEKQLLHWMSLRDYTVGRWMVVQVAVGGYGLLACFEEEVYSELGSWEHKR